MKSIVLAAAIILAAAGCTKETAPKPVPKFSVLDTVCIGKIDIRAVVEDRVWDHYKDVWRYGLIIENGGRHQTTETMLHDCEKA